MFSEASVSHSVYRGGGLHPGWGGSASEGSASRERVCIWEGLHPGRSASRRVGRGLGRSPWVCFKGDGIGQIPLIISSSGGHRSGRYASYWNAFLLFSTASVGRGLAKASLKKIIVILYKERHSRLHGTFFFCSF